MLDSETKRRIDTARDILVGKVPDPKSQVEQITIALIYKFMDDMDKEAVENEVYREAANAAENATEDKKAANAVGDKVVAENEMEDKEAVGEAANAVGDTRDWIDCHLTYLVL